MIKKLDSLKITILPLVYFSNLKTTDWDIAENLKTILRRFKSTWLKTLIYFHKNPKTLSKTIKPRSKTQISAPQLTFFFFCFFVFVFFHHQPNYSVILLNTSLKTFFFIVLSKHIFIIVYLLRKALYLLGVTDFKTTDWDISTTNWDIRLNFKTTNWDNSTTNFKLLSFLLSFLLSLL